MAAKHGTANRYNQGCRCDDCRTHTVSEQRITASAGSLARFKMWQICHKVWHRVVPVSSNRRCSPNSMD
jgi:hypothetical protein